MTDQQTSNLLRKFGLSYEEIGYLVTVAKEEEQTLAELVAFVLRDYTPATHWEPEERDDILDAPDRGLQCS